jgi:hypothetical protein
MAIRKSIATEKQLKQLKPESKPYTVGVKEARGMVVRVSIAGLKTFRWDRGSGHKPRVITHGTFQYVAA